MPTILLSKSDRDYRPATLACLTEYGGASWSTVREVAYRPTLLTAFPVNRLFPVRKAPELLYLCWVTSLLIEGF